MTPDLRRKRLLARWAIGWEGAWRAAWPALSVLALFLAFAWLGIPALLPAWAHLLVLLGVFGGLLVALRRGAREWRRPDDAMADRRLERASGLRHRPLAALEDRPAGGDPGLWALHQQRMRALLGRLRVGTPRPGLVARDRFALRAGAGLLALAALCVAGRDAPALLGRALLPKLGGPVAAAPALRVEAWVTPPAHTGAPPVFLPAAGGAATVPAGSKLQLAVSNAAGPSATGITLTPLGGGGHAGEAVLTEGTRVTLSDGGREVAAWALAVQADAPPVARFPEPPGRAPRGLGLRLPWQAEDDWGVHALRLEIRLAARPDAPPVTLEVALPAAAPRQARGLMPAELSAHPWAGLPVVATLRARDGAGQEGVSEEARFDLPERSFTHPVARELIAVRKGLSVAPGERVAAARALDAVLAAPERFEHDPATQLSVRTARTQLQRDRRPEAVAEVQELLWEAALALEEGRDERTARALAEAQQQLREALDEAERTPGEQAAREELQRRIEALREAIRRHLEALAERLQRENAEALPYDPQQRLLDQRDMERRTRRMEDAARQGRTEDARRELAELEEMLRALQEGRVARGEPPERGQQRQRGQQQMGAVQDLLRRQGEQLDAGERRAQGEEQRRRDTRRNQPPPAADPQAEAQRQSEARQQRALRRALGELMQQHGDLTGEVPEGLGQADQAMREAQEALGQGRDARPAQQEAMRRLQEAGRQMQQAMQRQMGRGQQGEGEPGDDMAGGEEGGEESGEEQQLGEGRDPLGRRGRETAGQAENGSDTRVPEEAELLRTRRLQEELRRRSGERSRAAEELDYIDRLLRRF